MPTKSWSIPREWASETAFILGGGASLKGFDAEILRGRGRVVAIKEAGLTMAPWADVLFWCDPHWLDANHMRLGLHTGVHKITRTDPVKRYSTTSARDAKRIEASLARHGVRFVPRDPTVAASTDPQKLGGAIDAGGSGINLASLFGASRIVLFGFDMRTTGHWHDRTLIEPEAAHYARFITPIERMAAALKSMGIQVINATPHSALTCFPFMEIEDVLAMDFTPHVRTIFQTRGRLASFTPDGGSASNCRVIAQGGGDAIMVGTVRAVVDRLCFHVRRAEIASPAAGDVLTYDSTDYTVEAVQPVENDPDRQMWSLEVSWGAAIGYRSASGSGATQSPPLGTDFKVSEAASAGAAAVSVSSSFTIGQLVAGDTLTIGANTYTVTGTVAAVSNEFEDVPITPVLASDAALNAAVTFDFLRDYSVRAAVSGYTGDDANAGVQIGDRRLVILQSALDGAGMTDDPKAGDRLTFEGKTFTVQSAVAHYSDGEPVVWDIQARG